MSYYISEINKAGKIAVDDTILVKSYPATAGSKMLEILCLFSVQIPLKGSKRQAIQSQEKQMWENLALTLQENFHISAQ